MAHMRGRRKRLDREIEQEKRVLAQERSAVRSCLVYTVIILGILLLMSLMFGGFRKGKVHDGSQNRPAVSGIAHVVSGLV
jgi:hypothetical protein